MQASYWHTLGSLCNPQWGSYKLHNFPIGRVIEPIPVERTSINVTRTTLSLYEMNKDEAESDLPWRTDKDHELTNCWCGYGRVTKGKDNDKPGN